jgi:hypothetical protein
VTDVIAPGGAQETEVLPPQVPVDHGDHGAH